MGLRSEVSTLHGDGSAHRCKLSGLPYLLVKHVDKVGTVFVDQVLKRTCAYGNGSLLARCRVE